MNTGFQSFAFLIFILLTACTTQESEKKASYTTLILVRHAEKANDSQDNPPLNEKGKARANLLASKLASTKLHAIYSTPFKRTLNTVEPVAKIKNLPITEYDPEKDLVTFLEEVLNNHPGETILIVGHSSTIPGMLNVLTTNKKYQNLENKDYNDFFIATTLGIENTSILHLNYGDSL